MHVEAKHLYTEGFYCNLCNKHCPTRNSLNIHKFRYHKPWVTMINILRCDWDWPGYWGTTLSGWYWILVLCNLQLFKSWKKYSEGSHWGKACGITRVHVFSLWENLSHSPCIKNAQIKKKALIQSYFLSYSFILIEIDDLVSSLMYKDENGKWVCNNCNYISYSSTSVREHVESRHIESQNYPCNICGHICPTRKALKMHIFRNKHYS